MDTKGEMRMKRTILDVLNVAAIVMALSAATVAQQAVAQTPAPRVNSTEQGIPEGGVKVTPDTYIRAETDRQFAEIVKMAGGVIASCEPASWTGRRADLPSGDVGTWECR
jgi:hypothetical protein